MSSPVDSDRAVPILQAFGVGPDDLLGAGGEAAVYALDGGRVLRVLHEGGTLDDVTRRRDLLDELGRSHPAFALPCVLEVGERAGRVYALEVRLPGRSVSEMLGEVEGSARARLVEAYLDAAASLGDLQVAPRAGFGDLLRSDAISTPTWREYLAARARASLQGSPPEFARVDPDELAAALPDASCGAFVHLDAFAGNMLTDGTRITAVIDIGPTSLLGDRRLDPLSAAVYLASPEITPTARPEDMTVASGWLAAAGLSDWFEPARRWLAAYWAWATDDHDLARWCRAVLVEGRADRL